MEQSAESGWNRRDFIGAAALFALAVGVPIAAVKLSNLDAEDAPSERQRALLREVAQLVIPRTGTPGAGELGVGDFVALALAHGLEDSRRPVARREGGRPLPLRGDGTVRHVDWLEAELDRHSSGDFLSQPAATRTAVLAALDAEAYPEGPPPKNPSPWRTIKALVLTGYYTTEVGGAQELRFELVPGRYDPDLPVTPETRAWSSDWTAVDFG